MRLTVNGTPIRVTDRIEIEIDVPKDGDTLLNGVTISIRGGPLTIEEGDSPKHAALWIGVESQVTFKSNYDNGSHQFVGYQNPRPTTAPL